MRLIIGVGFCIRSFHLAVCERSGDFIGIALFIRSNEMQGSPVESADIACSSPACGRHFITGLFKIEERSGSEECRNSLPKQSNDLCWKVSEREWREKTDPTAWVGA